MKKQLKQRLACLWTLLILAGLIAACAPAGSSASTNGTANSNTQASSTVSNTTTVSGTTASTSGGVTEIHIGYQRGGEYWNLLKAQGTLEKRFGPNVKVTWSLFPAGPPLLEALNAGAVDIGKAQCARPHAPGDC